MNMTMSGSLGIGMGMGATLGRKESWRESTLLDSKKNKLKGIDSVESIKIDGWNTVPVLRDGLHLKS